MFLTVTILSFMLCKVSCYNELNEVSALHCPPGWIAQSQSWYANAGNIPKVEANVISSNSVWFKENGDQNPLTQSKSLAYKICVVCEAMDDHPQKLIEVCGTKFISKTSNASWHYERQNCPGSSTKLSQVNWCSPAPVCGLFVKHYLQNLFKTLMAITPIFCQVHKNEEKIIDDLSLKCPDGLPLTQLEIHNTMCASNSTESFCIVCSSNKTEISICAPKNCSKIDNSLDFKTITKPHKSYQLNLLLNNSLKYCGFILSYTMQGNWDNRKLNDSKRLIDCQPKRETPCSFEQSTTTEISALSICLAIVLVILAIAIISLSIQYKKKIPQESVYLMTSNNPFYNETEDAAEPYDIPIYNEVEQHESTHDTLPEPYDIPIYNEVEQLELTHHTLPEPYDIPIYNETEQHELTDNTLLGPYNILTYNEEEQCKSTHDTLRESYNIKLPEPYDILRYAKEETQDPTHKQYNTITNNEEEHHDPTQDSMPEPYNIITYNI